MALSSGLLRAEAARRQDARVGLTQSHWSSLPARARRELDPCESEVGLFALLRRCLSRRQPQLRPAASAPRRLSPSR